MRKWVVLQWCDRVVVLLCLSVISACSSLNTPSDEGLSSDGPAAFRADGSSDLCNQISNASLRNSSSGELAVILDDFFALDSSTTSREFLASHAQEFDQPGGLFREALLWRLMTSACEETPIEELGSGDLGALSEALLCSSMTAAQRSEIETAVQDHPLSTRNLLKCAIVALSGEVVLQKK